VVVLVVLEVLVLVDVVVVDDVLVTVVVFVVVVTVVVLVVVVLLVRVVVVTVVEFVVTFVTVDVVVVVLVVLVVVVWISPEVDTANSLIFNASAKASCPAFSILSSGTMDAKPVMKKPLNSDVTASRRGSTSEVVETAKVCEKIRTATKTI